MGLWCPIEDIAKSLTSATKSLIEKDVQRLSTVDTSHHLSGDNSPSPRR